MEVNKFVSRVFTNIIYNQIAIMNSLADIEQKISLLHKREYKDTASWMHSCELAGHLGYRKDKTEEFMQSLDD